jgi:hypothetical protein
VPAPVTPCRNALQAFSPGGHKIARRLLTVKESSDEKSLIFAMEE